MHKKIQKLIKQYQVLRNTIESIPTEGFQSNTIVSRQARIDTYNFVIRDLGELIKEQG